MITIDQIELPMKTIKSFKDIKNLNDFQRKHLEPTSTLDATKRVVEILDAKYEKANLAEIISDSCGHLSSQQQHKLLNLLVEHKELFDGTLGDLKTEPVSLKLKKDAKSSMYVFFPTPLQIKNSNNSTSSGSATAGPSVLLTRSTTV